jgi:hypothetical protein
VLNEEPFSIVRRSNEGGCDDDKKGVPTIAVEDSSSFMHKERMSEVINQKRMGILAIVQQRNEREKRKRENSKRRLFIIPTIFSFWATEPFWDYVLLHTPHPYSGSSFVTKQQHVITKGSNVLLFNHSMLVMLMTVAGTDRRLTLNDLCRRFKSHFGSRGV